MVVLTNALSILYTSLDPISGRGCGHSTQCVHTTSTMNLDQVLISRYEVIHAHLLDLFYSYAVQNTALQI